MYHLKPKNPKEKQAMEDTKLFIDRHDEQEKNLDSELKKLVKENGENCLLNILADIKDLHKLDLSKTTYDQKFEEKYKSWEDSYDFKYSLFSSDY